MRAGRSALVLVRSDRLAAPHRENNDRQGAHLTPLLPPDPLFSMAGLNRRSQESYSHHVMFVYVCVHSVCASAACALCVYVPSCVCAQQMRIPSKTVALALEEVGILL